MSKPAEEYLKEKYETPTNPIRVREWDYKQCAKEMQDFSDQQFKERIEGVTDSQIELDLLKDRAYKRYGDRAKEAYFFGAKWLKDKLLKSIEDGV